MLRKWISLALLALLAFPVWVLAQSQSGGTDAAAYQQAENYFAKKQADAGPCTKPDGSKFTIGYVDLDPYPATGEWLYRFIEQLRADGWIAYSGELPFDVHNTDAKRLIEYLSHQDLGDYLQFSGEVNYYISESCDGEAFVRKDLQKHVRQKDIDLLLCLGTQPAELVIHKMGITQVPVMVSAVVDPVASGLVESEEYSGKPNVWVHTNNGIYTNQMKLYYDSCPFQNIGMVYYDESIASLESYQKAADELGFVITAEKISPKVTDTYYDRLEKIYRKLAARGIDAFLLNSDIIKDESRIRPLLEIFYEKDIPVFVQTSEYYVRDGAVMLIESLDAQLAAPFLTGTMSQILNGKRPGEISQSFVTPPYLSINLKAADQTGFPVTEDMILSAGRLYHYIETVLPEE